MTTGATWIWLQSHTIPQTHTKQLKTLPETYCQVWEGTCLPRWIFQDFSWPLINSMTFKAWRIDYWIFKILHLSSHACTDPELHKFYKILDGLCVKFYPLHKLTNRLTCSEFVSHTFKVLSVEDVRTMPVSLGYHWAQLTLHWWAPARDLKVRWMQKKIKSKESFKSWIRKGYN